MQRQMKRRWLSELRKSLLNFKARWSTDMPTDENPKKCEPCEDALVVIGDIAVSAMRLQRVLASGVASKKVADACELLFSEIADLAGAGSDT